MTTYGTTTAVRDRAISGPADADVFLARQSYASSALRHHNHCLDHYVSHCLCPDGLAPPYSIVKQKQRPGTSCWPDMDRSGWS